MKLRLRWYLLGISVTVGVFVVLNLVPLHLLRKDDREKRRFSYALDSNTYIHVFRSNDCAATADEFAKLRKNLIETTKAIMKAKSHVRGLKTGRYLSDALVTMRQVLGVLQVKDEEVKSRQKRDPTNVCPEEYKGSTYGYPFFNKGFEITNCSYSKPDHQLVTVVLLYKPTIMNMTKILNGIKDSYGNISILIGALSDQVQQLKRNIISNENNVSVKPFSKEATAGAMLNSLVKEVKTPYIFIGRDLTHLTNDSRLERLIRVIEELDVDVSAGASRDSVGRWKQNCYQTAIKNYSLIYIEGYDESLEECIVCDHTNSPFIIKTKTAKQMPFNEKIKQEGIFEDFFLRLNQQNYESVVCPDSMFHTHFKQLNTTESWAEFASIWNIFHLKIQPGLQVKFPCTSYKCANIPGYALAPCCLQEIANLLKFILGFCEANNIICELQEGTLLGAVKFEKVLPWERDGDLTFLTTNFSALQRIVEDAQKAGYKVCGLYTELFLCSLATFLP